MCSECLAPVPLCQAELFAGTYWQPPEWCPEDALPGEEFCEQHRPAPEPEREKE